MIVYYILSFGRRRSRTFEEIKSSRHRLIVGNTKELNLSPLKMRLALTALIMIGHVSASDMPTENLEDMGEDGHAYHMPHVDVGPTTIQSVAHAVDMTFSYLSMDDDRRCLDVLGLLHDPRFSLCFNLSKVDGSRIDLFEYFRMRLRKSTREEAISHFEECNKAEIDAVIRRIRATRNDMELALIGVRKDLSGVRQLIGALRDTMSSYSIWIESLPLFDHVSEELQSSKAAYLRCFTIIPVSEVMILGEPIADYDCSFDYPRIRFTDESMPSYIHRGIHFVDAGIIKIYMDNERSHYVELFIELRTHRVVETVDSVSIPGRSISLEDTIRIGNTITLLDVDNGWGVIDSFAAVTIAEVACRADSWVRPEVTALLEQGAKSDIQRMLIDAIENIRAGRVKSAWAIMVKLGFNNFLDGVETDRADQMAKAVQLLIAMNLDG